MIETLDVYCREENLSKSQKAICINAAVFLVLILRKFIIPRMLGRCAIIIIKLLNTTHRTESRFLALLTRTNDYVLDPNLDVRYRITRLATYVRSHSITSRLA